MLKEIKYILYLLFIFFTIFFVLKYYLSNQNVKLSNKILSLHEKELHSKYENLLIIKNDTKNIILYQNEIDKFKNKEPRKFWDLIK